MPHPLSRPQPHGGRDVPCLCPALCLLPDGSGGHGGTLSLLEDDGETAQRLIIPILPRNDTYSRDHHRRTGTIVGHAVKESPCTCHPPNKKLPLATSSWPSLGCFSYRPCSFRSRVRIYPIAISKHC